ncbi:MAG: hypothetical protein PHT40_00735 [Patescibacteria group bacterium]|nr:hypothetical protein [Patescibacteria group bacterium]
MALFQICLIGGLEDEEREKKQEAKNEMPLLQKEWRPDKVLHNCR